MNKIYHLSWCNNVSKNAFDYVGTAVVGTLYRQNSQMRQQNASCSNIFCLRCRRCPIIQCIFAHIVATTAAINFIHWCNGAAAKEAEEARPIEVPKWALLTVN